MYCAYIWPSADIAIGKQLEYNEASVVSKSCKISRQPGSRHACAQRLLIHFDGIDTCNPVSELPVYQSSSCDLRRLANVQMGDAVLLPDGRVFACNGAQMGRPMHALSPCSTIAF